MKEVTIYTDGACRGNPGRGGWGAILVWGKYEKEMSGGEELTTNNRMELSAAIAGLRALKEPCTVTLVSDSKYMVDAFNLHWVDEWQEKDFRRGTKNEIKNPDLWEELISLTKIHTVTFKWVKGHNGHDYNERCDALATAFADSFLLKGEPTV
ncbi:MAG: ribonuclease HI [Clostridia bacterium]|nr:ribonuclease HI [Clostridia bacterium]